MAGLSPPAGAALAARGGLRTFAPVGEMKLVVDDVAIYWAARK